MNSIICGDVLEVLSDMEPGSVHMTMCSPPYWGLRDYGIDGGVGLESTPEEYVANLVEIFREVKRVMRPDGTLWLNLGDSYAAGGGGFTPQQADYKKHQENTRRASTPNGLKPKDLCMIPERVVMALQADGWWVRQKMIWHKPNPMPCSQQDRPTTDWEYVYLLAPSANYFYDADAVREVYDKPLNRWGGDSLKETTAKQAKYFDQQGIGSSSAFRPGRDMRPNPSGRTMRSVWKIPTEPCSWDYCDNCHTLYEGRNRNAIQIIPDPDDPEPDDEKKTKVRLCPKCKHTKSWVDHFAAYPLELCRRPILAGTSEKGACPECGAQWVRVVEKEGESKYNEQGKPQGINRSRMAWGDSHPTKNVRWFNTNKTVGWKPGCDCGIKEVVPPVVLDPFCGSGQTGIKAVQLGRSFIGIDLKPEYCRVAESRIKHHTAHWDKPLD